MVIQTLCVGSLPILWVEPCGMPRDASSMSSATASASLHLHNKSEKVGGKAQDRELSAIAVTQTCALPHQARLRDLQPRRQPTSGILAFAGLGLTRRGISSKLHGRARHATRHLLVNPVTKRAKAYIAGTGARLCILRAARPRLNVLRPVVAICRVLQLVQLCRDVCRQLHAMVPALSAMPSVVWCKT